MPKYSHRKRPPIQALVEKIKNLDDISRDVLAEKCGTSIGNLRQIAYGYGGCSPALAKKIIENSGCDVTFEQLIPELAMA